MEDKINTGIITLEGIGCFSGKTNSKNINIRGELVFCTAMTGYQATFTDISYMGQILIMSSVEIGNVGINSFENQSEKPTIAALVIKNLSNDTTHYEAKFSLLEWLNHFNIPVLWDVETRQIIRKLVKNKKSIASIKSGIFLNYTDNRLEERSIYRKRGNFLTPINIQNKLSIKNSIILIDFGFKEAIFANIKKHISNNCIIMNGNSESDRKVLKNNIQNIKGIIISNGPGDPQSYRESITDMIFLKENKIPVLGICLGHQLLSLLYGCKIEKLTYGHRSITHPVIEHSSRKIMITSHNHSYVVSKESINKGQVTYSSLFDGAIEGIRWDSKITSVQFHPEASPGTYEAHKIFSNFRSLIDQI